MCLPPLMQWIISHVMAILSHVIVILFWLWNHGPYPLGISAWTFANVWVAAKITILIAWLNFPISVPQGGFWIALIVVSLYSYAIGRESGMRWVRRRKEAPTSGLTHEA